MHIQLWYSLASHFLFWCLDTGIKRDYRAGNQWADPFALMVRARMSVGTLLASGYPPDKYAPRPTALTQGRYWQDIDPATFEAIVATPLPRSEGGAGSWSQHPTLGARHIHLPLHGKGHRLRVDRSLWVLTGEGSAPMQVWAATRDPTPARRSLARVDMLFGVRFVAATDVSVVAQDERRVGLQRLKKWGWTLWRAQRDGYAWIALGSVTSVVCPLDVGEQKGTLFCMPPPGMLRIHEQDEFTVICAEMVNLP